MFRPGVGQRLKQSQAVFYIKAETTHASVQFAENPLHKRIYFLLVYRPLGYHRFPPARLELASIHYTR
jgi:hypothetical protein